MGASWLAGTRAAEGVQSLQQVRCGQSTHLHHCDRPPRPVLRVRTDPRVSHIPTCCSTPPCFRLPADRQGERHNSRRGQTQERCAGLRPLHPRQGHRSGWWEPAGRYPEPPCQPSSREWHLHPIPPPPKGTNLISSAWCEHPQPPQSSDTIGRRCSAGHAHVPARQSRPSASRSRDKNDPQ